MLSVLLVLVRGDWSFGQTTQPESPVVPTTVPDQAPPPSTVEESQRREDRRQRRRRQREQSSLSGVEIVQNVVYGEAENRNGTSIELLMDVAVPRRSDQKSLPAVIYVHGGGFRSGSKEQGGRFIESLARSGYFAASINYRLVGVAPYPAAVFDVKQAVRFIRENASSLGIDPNRIGIIGVSAGAHLASLIGTSSDAEVFEAGEETSSAVACVVAIAGTSDLTTFALQRRPRRGSGQWIEAPESEYEGLLRQASPLTYVSEDDPPYLLLHGTADEVVPVAQSEGFAKALRSKNVEVALVTIEGAGHGFKPDSMLMPTAEFLDAKLGGNLVIFAEQETNVPLRQQNGERPRRQGSNEQPSRTPFVP